MRSHRNFPSTHDSASSAREHGGCTMTAKHRRRTLGAICAVVLFGFAVIPACGSDDADTATSEGTTSSTVKDQPERDDRESAEETTTSAEETTTSAEETAPALSAEDEAACRYMTEQLEQPGGYDSGTVFSTMADMARDGGAVEAAAQTALVAWQETGDVGAAAAAGVVVACMSVIGE